MAEISLTVVTATKKRSLTLVDNNGRRRERLASPKLPYVQILLVTTNPVDLRRSLLGRWERWL